MLTPPKLTNGNIPCVAFPVPPYKLLSSLKILQHFTFRMLNRFLFFRIRSNCSRSQFPELPRRFSPPQSRIRFSVSRNPSVRLCLSNAKISVSVPQWNGITVTQFNAFMLVFYPLASNSSALIIALVSCISSGLISGFVWIVLLFLIYFRIELLYYIHGRPALYFEHYRQRKTKGGILYYFNLLLDTIEK